MKRHVALPTLATEAPLDSLGLHRARLGSIDWYPWLLAAAVLLARVLTRSQLYFADGPGQVKAIRNRTFVVQPPGYWLFDRLAGFFSDPVLAISVFNVLCSAFGVVFFYY